jgi:hypothetical protein
MRCDEVVYTDDDAHSDNSCLSRRLQQNSSHFWRRKANYNARFLACVILPSTPCKIHSPDSKVVSTVPLNHD